MKKFLIKVNGNSYEVEVEEVKVGAAAVQAPDNKAAALPASVSAPITSAAIQASAVTAPKVPDAEVKPAAQKSGPQTGSSGKPLTAPMPGTILKVNVNDGDVIKKGQVLLILEAMKMENEITAPSDGAIASINVEKGKLVSVGETLLTISGG